MRNQILIQSGTLRLVVKSLADASAIELLKNTTYGTHGIRYQHTGQERKVHELYDPFFFYLYIGETLQGLYCLDHRVTDGKEGIDAFYGRYLTVAVAAQRNGYGQLLKTEAVKYVSEQFAKPFLFYSYIEEKNTRSLRLSQQLDFKPVARLKTFVFRDLYPKIDERFGQLADPSVVLPKLKAYYESYSLTVLGKVLNKDNYFVLKEGETVMAGVHANPVTWQFAHMPGLMGWLMMNGFPRIPILKKLFQPTYTFLALEGVYLRAGYEHLLSSLLESVLAYFNLNTALMEIDTKDRLINLVQAQANRLSGFQKNVTTQVLVKPIGLTDTQFERIQENPVYVSSFDFT